MSLLNRDIMMSSCWENEELRSRVSVPGEEASEAEHIVFCISERPKRCSRLKNMFLV